MPRRTYQDRTAAQLDAMAADLASLRDGVFEQPGRFDVEERRRLEALRDEYQRARRHFDAMRAADHWQDLKPEMDRLLKDLARNLDEARGEQQARV